MKSSTSCSFALVAVTPSAIASLPLLIVGLLEAAGDPTRNKSADLINSKTFSDICGCQHSDPAHIGTTRSLRFPTMYRQILDPVAHSLGLSSLVAAIPLAMLFVMLGVLRMRAWVASLLSVAVA